MRQDFLIIQNAPKLSLDIFGNKVALNDSIYKYIEKLSIVYGSSINGRETSVKALTNYKYKIPVIISNKFNIYFLKTRNLKAEDCILINYYWLDHYQKKGATTELFFRNGIKYCIDIDYRIIKRQIAIIRKYINRYDSSVL